MTILTSACRHLLALSVLLSVGGCEDDETCGNESLQVAIAPSKACLALSASLDTPGSYKIVGTNSCADPLVVHSPGTHDGGPNETFPAGAEVLIRLNDSEVFNQGTAVKTWNRNAVLGTETIVFTMTKTPC